MPTGLRPSLFLRVVKLSAVASVLSVTALLAIHLVPRIPKPSLAPVFHQPDVQRPVSLADTPVPKAVASKQQFRSPLENRLSFTWPLHGRLSRRFGALRLRNRETIHTGIDVSVPTGTPIKAAERGRVLWAAWREREGLCIIIEHPNGMQSLYAHCSKVLVKRGQWVSRLETIAKVGETGEASEPHLHFGLKRDGEMINPLKYLALKQL